MCMGCMANGDFLLTSGILGAASVRVGLRRYLPGLPTWPRKVTDDEASEFVASLAPAASADDATGVDAIAAHTIGVDAAATHGDLATHDDDAGPAHLSDRQTPPPAQASAPASTGEPATPPLDRRTHQSDRHAAGPADESAPASPAAGATEPAADQVLAGH